MKRKNIVGSAVLCAFLLVISVGYLLLPKRDFSRLEKRNLEKMPEFTINAILDGSWAEETEDFLADQMPGRDFFVGLNAYYEKMLGLQKAKPIWVLNGKLVRRPVKAQQGVMERQIGAINRFAEQMDVPVALSLIPSCGFALEAPEYKDEALIGEAYVLSNVETIDLRETFRGRPDLFYSTDHHWTSAGAFEAYRVLMGCFEKPVETAYLIETFDNFRGANYAASGLWLTPAEKMELWTGPAPITSICAGVSHEGVFFRDQLEEYDPYQVFLNGNQPLIHLYNPNGHGKLLVVRDSFASSLAGFLAQSYAQVTLVDLRHYKQPLSLLVEQEHFDQILVLYSLENLITDTNLILLR